MLGVFYWLKQHFPERAASGMNVLIRSDVPLNKGVSSSAAVEVAVMKAAAQAYGIELAGVELAEACQWVENVIAESACGIMDQIAVVLGDEGYVLPLVCQPCLPQPLVRLPDGFDLLGHRLGRAAPGERHRIRSGPGRRLHGLQVDLRSPGTAGHARRKRRDPALDRSALERLPGQPVAVGSIARSKTRLPMNMTGERIPGSWQKCTSIRSRKVRARNRPIACGPARATPSKRTSACNCSSSWPAACATATSTDGATLMGELMYQSH